jgi:hypothetical protein
MKFWPFKRDAQKNPKEGEFDSVVWATNTLAKVALMPIVNRFPDYGSIIDSNLVDLWDSLMTIAMTGVAAHAEGMLSNSQVQDDIKRALSEQWQIDADLFDDYYEYTKVRTNETKAPWCGVSAMWVADNLRLHGKATAELKRNSQKLDFVNRLSAFMNVSFRSTEVGFSHYFGFMALDVEKNMGIDMRLGTQGTKKESPKKIPIIAHIFESFAQKTVELIAEKQ